MHARFTTVLLLCVLAGCAPSGSGEVGAAREALNVCPDGPTVSGIDVSRWQGTIDWDAVAGSGLDFAITRVGDGSYEDPTFDGNYAAIRDRGMVRGSYQFFRPNLDAVAQADIVIRHVGELGAGDLAPVIDVESTPGEALPSAAVMRAQIRAWVDRVQMALGRTPMIYTGSYFWDDNVGSVDFGANPLWIAHWGTDCPRMPMGWTRWDFHQTSASGSIPGISGDVDTDVFNGTRAALDAFTAPPGCTPSCEGDVVIAADCGRGDCAMFGARCVDDAVGVRCVSVFCPDTGEADVCLPDDELAHCTDGMLASSERCADTGRRCVAAGSSASCTDVGALDGSAPGRDAGIAPRDAGSAPPADAGDPGGRMRGGAALDATCGCHAPGGRSAWPAGPIAALGVALLVAAARRRAGSRAARAPAGGAPGVGGERRRAVTPSPP